MCIKESDWLVVLPGVTQHNSTSHTHTADLLWRWRVSSRSINALCFHQVPMLTCKKTCFRFSQSVLYVPFNNHHSYHYCYDKINVYQACKNWEWSKLLPNFFFHQIHESESKLRKREDFFMKIVAYRAILTAQNIWMYVWKWLCVWGCMTNVSWLFV